MLKCFTKCKDLPSSDNFLANRVSCNVACSSDRRSEKLRYSFYDTHIKTTL